MAYEKKDGDAVLFLNNRKKNDKEPDLRGKIFIDGKDYDLAFWEKQGQYGKYYSGKRGGETQERSQQRSSFPQRREAAPQPKQQDAFNDDVPWDT